MKDGAGRMLRIKQVPRGFVLAGVLRSLDPFTRPIGTMSEQWGRNGAAWRVSFLSASNSSHVGAMYWKCVISQRNTSRDQGGLLMIASAAP